MLAWRSSTVAYSIGYYVVAHCAKELRTPVDILTGDSPLQSCAAVRCSAVSATLRRIPHVRLCHRGGRDTALHVASKAQHRDSHAASGVTMVGILLCAIRRIVHACACSCGQTGVKRLRCAPEHARSVWPLWHCSTPKLRGQVMSHAHTCKANPAAAAEVRPCVHTVAQCSVCPHRTIH